MSNLAIHSSNAIACIGIAVGIERETMKFCKKYEEYMQEQNQKELPLPGVGFKKLASKSCLISVPLLVEPIPNEVKSSQSRVKVQVA